MLFRSALVSHQLSCILSTKVLLSMQLGRWIWFDACSSTLRLYWLLDGPSDSLSVEWTYDIMRATTYFATITIFIRPEYLFHIVTVSRAYSVPILGAFVSLCSIFSAWCFIYSKDLVSELIKLWYNLTLAYSHWFAMKTKAFHNQIGRAHV